MKPKSFAGRLLAALILAGLATPAIAAPKLAQLFSDHAVLQRGRPIAIWGSADPGERLTVTLGDASQQRHRRPRRRLAGRAPRHAGGRTLCADRQRSVRPGDRERPVDRRCLALLGPVQHGAAGQPRAQQLQRHPVRQRSRAADPHRPAPQRVAARPRVHRSGLLAGGHAPVGRRLLGQLLLHGPRAAPFAARADRRDRIELGRHADPRLAGRDRRRCRRRRGL